LLLGMAGRPPLVGGPAPPFTLNDLEGRPASLSDYQGKVVLLNFWATWCEPCKKEMPEMQSAYEKYKDQGFVILAVNFGEKTEEAGKFSKEMGLTFPVLIDRKVAVASRYNIVSLPVSFYMDPEGFIQKRVFGGTLTKENIEEVLREIQRERK
jgi:peroxiredoxin